MNCIIISEVTPIKQKEYLSSYNYYFSEYIFISYDNNNLTKNTLTSMFPNNYSSENKNER